MSASLPRLATLFTGVLAGALASLVAAAQPAAEIDPWQALSELRLQLAASGDLTATFVQRFVPSGFSSGDEERGTVALALPDCLRWDYADPYPKSFLLCGARLHSWVRGEPQGQRMAVAAEEEPGLDLLLLPIGRLRERYRANAESTSGGRISVHLSPVVTGASLRDATLTFDLSTQRPTTLAYRDREGNSTRFDFGDFTLLDDPSIFTAPPALEWKEP